MIIVIDKLDPIAILNTTRTANVFYKRCKRSNVEHSVLFMIMNKEKRARKGAEDIIVEIVEGQFTYSWWLADNTFCLQKEREK